MYLQLKIVNIEYYKSVKKDQGGTIPPPPHKYATVRCVLFIFKIMYNACGSRARCRRRRYAFSCFAIFGVHSTRRAAINITSVRNIKSDSEECNTISVHACAYTTIVKYFFFFIHFLHILLSYAYAFPTEKAEKKKKKNEKQNG